MQYIRAGYLTALTLWLLINLMNFVPHTRAFDGARRPTIATTLELIRELHEGQFDGQGDPYVLHPQRVAANLLQICPLASDDMVMAALLHDVVEDCKHKGVDIEFLRQKGYSDETLEIVEILTKPEGDQRPYPEVIEDIIAMGNRQAMLVKIGDNMDNLHPERIMREDRYIASIKRLSAAVGWNAEYIFNTISSAKLLSELNAEHARA